MVHYLNIRIRRVRVLVVILMHVILREVWWGKLIFIHLIRAVPFHWLSVVERLIEMMSSSSRLVRLTHVFLGGLPRFICSSKLWSLRAAKSLVWLLVHTVTNLAWLHVLVLNKCLVLVVSFVLRLLSVN